MNEQVFKNARIVLPDEVIDGAVVPYEVVPSVKL